MENRVMKFRAWDKFSKYEIGDNGSVWSLNYNNSKERKEMKQYLDQDGYPYVVFVVDGKRYKRIVHRLVAISFIPNPENKPQVNHINSIRHDNRIENLEWNTAKENCIHAYKSNGRKMTETQRIKKKIGFTGANNPKAKLNINIVLQIRSQRTLGVSLKELSKQHNVSVSQISSITTNRTWKI